MSRRFMGVLVLLATGFGIRLANGAIIVPVERRMDAKAALPFNKADDPPEVTVGAVYGTHSATAQITEWGLYMGFPVESSSSISITSIVQPDLVKVDMRSTDTCNEGAAWGQADGSATVVFEITKPTTFRVSWDYGGMIYGSIWIPISVDGQASTAGKRYVWNDRANSAWPETDAIYEYAPGRYTLSLGYLDDHEAGSGIGGHMSFSMQVVPEPAALSLVPLVCLALRRRRS